eukprot:scaffold75324_cov69-Phaeocystis_antarctica.AAC.4
MALARLRSARSSWARSSKEADGRAFHVDASMLAAGTVTTGGNVRPARLIAVACSIKHPAPLDSSPCPRRVVRLSKFSSRRVGARGGLSARTCGPLPPRAWNRQTSAATTAATGTNTTAGAAKPCLRRPIKSRGRRGAKWSCRTRRSEAICRSAPTC